MLSQEKRDSGQFTEDDDDDCFVGGDGDHSTTSATTATTANTTDKKRVTINHPREKFFVFFSPHIQLVLKTDNFTFL